MKAALLKGHVKIARLLLAYNADVLRDRQWAHRQPENHHGCGVNGCKHTKKDLPAVFYAITI